MRGLVSVLGGFTMIVLQFALGHALGFGGSVLLAMPEWSPVVIALGNAVGVTLVAAIAFRVRSVSPAAKLAAGIAPAFGAALAGSAAGMVLTLSFLRIEYDALVIPIALSITCFHVARFRIVSRAVARPSS